MRSCYQAANDITCMSCIESCRKSCPCHFFGSELFSISAAIGWQQDNFSISSIPSHGFGSDTPGSQEKAATNTAEQSRMAMFAQNFSKYVRFPASLLADFGQPDACTFTIKNKIMLYPFQKLLLIKFKHLQYIIKPIVVFTSMVHHVPVRHLFSFNGTQIESVTQRRHSM